MGIIHKHRKWMRSFVSIGLFIFVSSFLLQAPKPVLYIIGDSTVKNGTGKGEKDLWGWGSFMAERFDTTRISVQNHAIGGRSSRTFITEGRWDRILEQLHPGDYVMMQFGHNDASPLDDTARARGTIKGIGDDSAAIYNPIRKVNEVVYSYGWYMRKYINDTKAKGAVPIVCSPVPRNNFRNGKTERANESYGKWAAAVAKAGNAFFIPLNDLIADEYDKLGADSVKRFFPVDHTHPDKAGSTLNADLVVKGIKDLKKCTLKKYLKK
ncbi:rhamnogalacturonan acetylesterase [Longitalea luteola]|uniref:rhamnogalacturonan acetylesterase n=1 Tax=Longitalea luteola TaxID=2812563 RepID=UPI001F607B92|nr:rhamnogalacturonan acetylesterase [Longitalea luteola]